MAERQDLNNMWNSKWEANEAGWQMMEVNSFAKKYFHVLTEGNISGKRILVPLCGATPDMAWFYEQGLTVVGIELSDLAIKKFFEDNNLSFVEETRPSGKVYSHDERLKLFQFDLFDLDVESLGGYFDYWWDRGSLVAMVAEEEHNYIEKLCSFMSKTARCLMEIYEYDSSIRTGPPRSIFSDRLNELFGDRFNIKELNRANEEDLPESHSRVGCSAVYVFYLLARFS